MGVVQSIAATAALFVALLAPAVAAEAPHVVAKRVSEDVVTVIKADPTLAKDRERSLQLVETKILPYFDFASMTRLAVGRPWREASPAQQEQLTREFRTLLVRTYVASLDVLREAEIEFRPAVLQGDGKRAIVKALVKRPGMQPLSMEMAVERQGETWRVYDVAFESLSLVTNYRTEFGTTIQREGIDGLIRVLASRNAQGSQNTARQ